MARTKNKPEPAWVDAFTARLRVIARRIGSGNSFADKLGHSRAGVRKWLAGDAFPNAYDIARICDLAGVRVQWLLYGAEPQTANDAKFVTEKVAGNAVDFYERDYIREVALALGNQAKSRDMRLTSSAAANQIVALCYLFRSTKIEPEGIDVFLDQLAPRWPSSDE